MANEWETEGDDTPEEDFDTVDVVDVVDFVDTDLPDGEIAERMGLNSLTNDPDAPFLSTHGLGRCERCDMVKIVADLIEDDWSDEDGHVCRDCEPHQFE